MNHFALPRLCAAAFAFLALPLFASPADASCTPATSTASPVTNSTVTCTGVTSNQNAPFGLGTGYGTLNEMGDTIDVQPLASVTGDAFGFALADGNTVNNSGAVTGGADGIITTTGSNIIVNNLTAASTISGTNSAGLAVTDVVLSNAGTIAGGAGGILSVGAVTLASNTGFITGTGPNSAGISAFSVSGSNAGTISGTLGITTSPGTGDINLSSNSGAIQGTNGFGITSGGSVVIGSNSGSIDGVGIAVSAAGTIGITNTGSITASGPFSEAIVGNGNVSVNNSGTISAQQRAVISQLNNLDLTNNFGGSITSGGDAVASAGTATVANAGTITSQNGNGVFISNGSITNNATGVIESDGTNAEAVVADSLLLNNAGIVRVTNTIFFAVDATTIVTGSINSGTISGNLAAINAFDSIDMSNTGTITGGILAIQATNTITFDNMGTGTVSGDRAGIITVAGDVEIMNSGTITATGGSGLQAIAIISLTGNITNNASGIISATGTAANNDAINTADTTTVDNFGMISSTGRSGVRVGGNSNIINETGGTIIGVTGIVVRDAGLGFGAPANSSVFNAGTITGTGGTAINFAFTAGAGPMTLTLAPGSVINGLVLGTGADTFQLGGKGSDTFDVDNIGATQQYQGFVAFNEVGSSIWTLTGTGNQAWHIFSGTLIGTTNTFAADIINDGTIEFVQDIDGTYANSISGSGNFLKGGTGIVTLSGANTYSGATTIGTGTLAISGAGGIANSSDVSVHGTFDISAAAGGVSIQALDGDGSVVLGGNALSLTNANGFFSGVISGAGGLVLGSGVETLGGDNTYTGGTTINSGILTIGTGGATGSIVGDVVDNGALVFNRSDDIVFSGSISGTGELVKFGTGALTLSGSYSYSGLTNIASVATLVLGGGTNTLTGLIIDDGALVTEATSLTLSGQIEGGGSLSVIAGTTTLSGNNSYGGGTTVANGTLSISSDNNLGGGGLALEDGSTLQLTSTFVLTHAITVAGDPTFDVTGSNMVLVTAPITDGAVPGDLVKTGTGTLVLGALNTYTGGTIVNGGSLQLGDNGDHTSILGAISVSNGANLFVLNADFSQVTTVTLDNGSALFELFTNAGTAQIAATNNGAVAFFNNATAGQSQISLDHSILSFQDSASAGSAAISVGDAGMVAFLGSATAANSTIGMSGPGSIVFFGSSTAANAQINSSGTNAQLAFVQNATAANATITFSQPGVLEFDDSATADHAHIITTAISTVEFVSSSTAADAQIDAMTGGGIFFFDNASADQAQITLGGNATLQLSANASGGSATVKTGFGTTLFISGLTNGGTTLASLNGAGNVVLGSNILTIGSDNSNSTISGSVTGLGGLTKIGTGTLTLAGNNFFTGMTTISGGTLQVGDGGSTGNIGGDIVDNAALVFDLSGFVTVPGAISGTGTLAQIGSGTTILIGSNTYSGGTTIASGTLQIGNAGTIGSIVGDVVDNGTLAFARSDNITFSGVISGSGGLALVSSGTVTLTNTNTYTGGTTISGGTLQVGNGGTTGSIVGDVVDNATLTFDRSDAITFSALISGSGVLIQKGTGSLTLTGQDTYSGGTMISAGTLQIGNGGTSGSIVGDVDDHAALIFDRTDIVSFAGTVFGSGSLAQIGSGALILTSAHTYTGGTSISGGTLQLGTGGTTGSIIGDVVDDGTLIFDRSDTVTFPGAISGSGAVVQNGSGTLILTGTSSYTGTTTVNAGILAVNGSIATSAVTVNDGTTLKGNGTVGPLTLATGATVAPGNSIGTLHVAGSVSLASGSIYNVELNSAGQSDLIAATGAATIAPGALVQIAAAPGIYAATSHYVILTATGGVTGTFDPPTINLPFLVPELIYQPTEVDLILKLKDIDLTPFTHTPNEIATAAGVRAGGPQSVIFGQFLQDSENGLGFVTNALDQLSGEIHPSLVTAELEDSRLIRLSIMQRLRQAATGDASGTLAPAADTREIVDGVAIWTRAFANWGTVESDGNAATLDQNLSGILAGIDARVGTADIGIGGGYSHSHADQRNSVAKGGNGYVAVYGGWADGALALRAGATYGWGTRDIVRTVTFPGFAETLTSKEDQHGSQVFGELAYAANMEDVSLEPFAGITWDDASTGAFAEHGGAAALSGRGGDTSVAYSSLGVRLAARPVGNDALSLTPRASLSWQHAFGGLHPGQVLTFEDTGQRFLILGSLIDSDSADVELGLDAQIGSGGTVSFGYEGILSGRVRLNTLHAGLSWDF